MLPSPKNATTSRPATRLEPFACCPVVDRSPGRAHLTNSRLSRASRIPQPSSRNWEVRFFQIVDRGVALIVQGASHERSRYEVHPDMARCECSAGRRDLLNGGAGRDFMTGGSGSDVFQFDGFSESAVGVTRRPDSDLSAARRRYSAGKSSTTAKTRNRRLHVKTSDKIQRPALVQSLWDSHGRACSRCPFANLALPAVKPLLVIYTSDLPEVHDRPLPLQHLVQPPVDEPPTLSCQCPQACSQATS